MNQKNGSASTSNSPDSPLSTLAVRVPLLIVAGLLGVLVLFLVFGPARESSARKRNVVLIVADALRADHLGCYGFDRPTSPVIDRLAAEGLLCTDYNTVVPSTLASFTSMFTSKHTKDHGASRNGFVPFEKLPTLAEAFRDAGYETAAFVSSYCITSEFAVNKGFDHFDEEMTATTTLPDNQIIRPAKKTTDAFFRWLNARHGEKPFFVLIHYFDPHWPYEPPARHISAVRTTKSGIRTASYDDINKAKYILADSQGVPNDYVYAVHDLYCAEIRYMDDEIGRVVRRFRGKEKDETDTLMVFTSDHGETFWEHKDFFFHGLTVYETAINVPLIFNCPGLIPAGKAVELPFSNIDLAPTLCRLNGVAIPDSFTGSAFDSFIGLSEDRETQAGAESADGPDGERALRLRYSEATMPYKVEEDMPRPNYQKSKSIRRGPWKYVVYPFTEDPGELYNIEDDPDESNDLAGKQEHAQMIEAFKDELNRWANEFDRNKERDRITDSAADKLDKLGYHGGR